MTLMDSVFGETRTRLAARHALIAADGHVPSALPGVANATPYFLISPAMGANLTQLLIRCAAGGAASFEANDIETALFLHEGSCVLRIGDQSKPLAAGGYAFCPANTPLQLESAAEGTVLTCFRKVYEPLEGVDGPSPIFGNLDSLEGLPFLGNPRALLKTLFPDHFSHDLAMNVFTYEPGATLPFVETHIMEHGLIMLEGQGVYRLENQYYPVKAGDVIWMAPYCPQWFVAMGDTPASYLYYKNVNRHPHFKL